MPTGSFGLNPDTRAGGSLVGPGNSSQPRRDRQGNASGFGDPTSPWAGRSGGAWTGNQALAGQAAGGGGSGMGGSAFNGGIQNIPNSAVGTTGLYGLPGGTSPIPNPLAGAQSIVNTMYGPQQQILADQLARQRDQLGLIGVGADYQSDALRRDNALANQALGLDKQALGIDKNLIGTQQANLGKLRDILKKQYGLNDRTLSNTLKQLGIDESQLRDTADRKQWDLRSELTARGAFNTVANERGTGRISRDLMYGLGGIGTQREGARINFEGNRLGLDEKGIGYDNQAAGLNARLANIGLDTQRLGISEQQLANSLQDGLFQIGLGSQVSINSLLDAIGGTNSQQAQLAATILGEVAGYANLPPEVLAQIQYAIGARQGAGGGGSRPSTNRKRGRGPTL